jgi:hypothetical protein
MEIFIYQLFKTSLIMIQIEDWTIVTALIFLSALLIIYLFYFKLTKKLFPKQVNFHEEIKPHKALTVLSIEGSGIIKRIEMQTTENENSLVNITIDQTSYLVFGLNKKTIGPDKYTNENVKLLTIELQLDKKFTKSFTIFVNNRSSLPLNSNGNIEYELKEPIKPTLKAIASEL